jgi:hypothetical protein
MTLQHAQTSATLDAMRTRTEDQAIQSVRHTEATVARATTEAIGRELQAELAQIARDIVQISGVLARTDIPDWHRIGQTSALEALEARRQALLSRTHAHERQYQLLKAADEGVGARPSQC